MDGDFFFVIGIVLVVAAVVVSFFGIRDSERFPPNRAVMVGVTALFAAIVAATGAFAVVKARDEQEHRNAEQAEEEATAQEGAATEAPATPGGQPQASEGGNQQPPQPTGEAQAIDVSSPADGGLVFDPDGIQADPGSLTVKYTNPSPVPHSFALATANGNVLGETPVFASGEETVEVPNLQPGKYVFYCTVPGHREAGMEGNLTAG